MSDEHAYNRETNNSHERQDNLDGRQSQNPRSGIPSQQWQKACTNVLYDALDGGATRSLRLDGLGKSLAGAVLYMPLDER